jgi:hypothetical protein
MDHKHTAPIVLDRPIFDKPVVQHNENLVQHNGTVEEKLEGQPQAMSDEEFHSHDKKWERKTILKVDMRLLIICKRMKSRSTSAEQTFSGVMLCCQLDVCIR